MTTGSERDREPEFFQLDRAMCATLLATQRVGRLVLPGDEPRVVPVNYAVHGASLLFRCDAGARADEIDGLTVAFEVDSVDDRSRSGWSVIVRGKAIALDAEAAAVELESVDTWAPGPKEKVFVIPIENVSGRLLRGAVSAQPLDDRGYL